METFHALTFLLIHFTIPVAGIALYFMLLKHMKREGVKQQPVWSLFILFATYAAIFTICLSAIFWKWSDTLSLLFAWLIFPTPLIIGLVAYCNYNRRMLSPYHKYTFIAAIGYYLLLLILIIALMIFILISTLIL